ncbi:calcineurin-like phosphoesterase C-terminal domain-containing protein [Coprobacter sp.]|uniref:calcineurin-like phosphoesterase C-terminal domain-containing protein n=1 Tax=Coprobacter sp. TaxID=1941478 RepID=UPI003AB73B4C
MAYQKICEFHWQGNSNRCGTPNGYMIVDVDGDNVRWHFKPTGHDLNYQFKIYKPGEFFSQTEYIVANVWD